MAPASWRAGQRFSSMFAAMMICFSRRTWSSVSRMVKSAAEPHQLGVAAQDLHADRVERAEPGHALGAAFADQPADAVLHLARRLVGEGDGEDLRGQGAAAWRGCGRCARSARASCRCRRRRAPAAGPRCLHRLPLLGIELFEPGRAARRERARGDAAGARARGLRRIGWRAAGRSSVDSERRNDRATRVASDRRARERDMGSGRIGAIAADSSAAAGDLEDRAVT